MKIVPTSFNQITAGVNMLRAAYPGMKIYFRSLESIKEI